MPVIRMQLPRFSSWAALSLACLCGLPFFSSTQAAPPAWPQFRGPGGDAVAPDGAPPLHFGPNTNVVWKTPVPPGHSSPCIWDDQIYLTAGENGTLVTVCF